jgi:hypothetical protein
MFVFFFFYGFPVKIFPTRPIQCHNDRWDRRNKGSAMIASERFGAQPGSAAPGPIFCHGWDPTFYFGFDFGWENRHLKKMPCGFIFSN